MTPVSEHAGLPQETYPAVALSFRANGRPVSVRVRPFARLLDVLREELDLTGSKEGCGEGECGACAVLVDGVLSNACLVPALQVEGAEITTIEGLVAEPRWQPLLEAFVELNAAQCGICTPGMVVASAALLRQTTAPTDEELREALAGNLCRCTGYAKIFDAVRRAGAALADGARAGEGGK